MTETLPLVTFFDVSFCPECGVEMTLHTDGLRAVAEAVGDETLSITTLLRDGARITGACPTPTMHWGDPCHGELVWNLDTPNTWDADTGRALVVSRANLLETADPKRDCYDCAGTGHGPVRRDSATNQGYADDCSTCHGAGVLA